MVEVVDYRELDFRLHQHKYIIDAHAHIGEHSSFHIHRSDANSLVEIMDEVGVHAACVSSLTAISHDYQTGNDEVIEAAERYPGRIFGYAVPNPHFSDDIQSELERCFNHPGMRAIEIHPVFHRYPAEGTNYTPVYEFAEDRGVAILSHDWSKSDHLMKVAETYPRASFIQAHTAGSWNGRNRDEILEVASICPNVFVDIAASIGYYGAFKKMIQLVGADKVLYGSDCPYMDMGYQIGRVLLSGIISDVKDKVFYLNAVRVLRVE